MENTNMFRHPKYYKELRDAGNELAKRNAVKEDLACSGSSPARNKTDQAISDTSSTEASERAPGPGHKPQAPSSKLQAASFKHQASSFRTNLFKRQATSVPARVTSVKLQATSSKLPDL